MTLLARELDRCIIEGPMMHPDGSIGATVYLADTCLGFSGHFPGYPVLPAFIQVSLAHCVLEKALGKTMSILAIKNAKFTAPAKPGTTLTLLCSPCAPGTLWNCLVRTPQGVQISTFRMQCEGK